jgi:hypothetical protein
MLFQYTIFELLQPLRVKVFRKALAVFSGQKSSNIMHLYVCIRFRHLGTVNSCVFLLTYACAKVHVHWLQKGQHKKTNKQQQLGAWRYVTVRIIFSTKLSSLCHNQ